MRRPSFVSRVGARFVVRALGVAVALLLSASKPALAIARWSTSVGVLNQTPLEMAQALPGVDVGGTRLPVAIVFDSVPRFQLGLVDPEGGGGAGSMSFVTIDSAGANFALGTIAETTSGRIGGSYVTSAFDLRFWTCVAPCATVQTFAIDSVSVWIDSNSAASGDLFVVVGLDNATGFAQLFSSPDGSVWTPLRTVAPAGGFYRNFDGGERLGLAVEPVAALAGAPSGVVPDAIGMNCVFGEKLLAFPNVEKGVHCANGPVPIPYAAVLADVQDAGGQASPEIENRVFMDNGVLIGVFTRRQDGKVYLLRHPPGGVPTITPVGNSPAGPEFFGISLSGRLGFTRSHATMLHSEVGVRLEVLTDDSNLALAGIGEGPTDTPEGPVALLPAPPGCQPENCEELIIAGTHFYFFAVEGFTVGVGLSRRPISHFEDSFEPGNASRWSAVVP